MGLSTAQQAMLQQENGAKDKAKTPNQKSVLELWRLAADSIISALLLGKSSMKTVREEHVLLVHFPIGRWQRVYEILVKIIHDMDEDNPVNIQTLLDKWVGETRRWTQDEMQWFEGRVRLYEQSNQKLHAQNLKKNIPLLKKYSELARFEEQIEYSLTDLRNGTASPGEVLAVLPDTLQRIRQSSIQVVSPQVTGAQVIGGALHFSDDDTDDVILSPAAELNYVMGGLIKRNVTIFTGEQKSGKTRLSVAHALYCLMQGGSVAHFTLEESKAFALRRYAIMIAHQYILDKWGGHVIDENAIPLYHIDFKWWFSAAGKKHLRHPKRLEALNYAFEIVTSWGNRLRFYDMSDGVSKLDSLLGWMRSDADAYGVPTMTVVDHTHHIEVQLSNKGDTNADYVRVNAVAGPMHGWAVSSGTLLLLLAQRSGQANRGELANSNYTGIRGGERLAEVVTAAVIVRGQVDDLGETDLNHCHVYVRAQRFGTPHMPSIAIEIDPLTGWIVQPPPYNP